MQTLYISDLDGTLLSRDVTISEKTTKTINSLIPQGLSFTIATARTIASAGKITSSLNLNLPIILMNGVLVWDTKSKEYIRRAVLQRSDTDLIISILKTHELNAFMYTVSDNDMMAYYIRLSTDGMVDFYNERREKYYKSFTQVEDFSMVNADIIYFTLIYPKEMLQPVVDLLSSNANITMTFYEDIYNEGLWYLEIFSCKASKKLAVEFLRERLKPERIVSFGDNLNDLPMFEASDYKVAVANANEKVLSASDEVAGSNNNDGVARFIEKDFHRKDVY